MRTLYIVQQKKLKNRIKEKITNIPNLGNQDLLLENLACGICTTDLKYISNYKEMFENDKILKRKPGKKYLGHEVVCRVKDVGDKKYSYLIGQNVVVAEINSCRAFGINPECQYCRKKQGVFCEKKHKRKYNKSVFGGYSEYQIRTIDQIVLINKKINPEVAIFIEPLASVIHCARSINSSSTVIINGLGTISVLLLRYLKLNKKKIDIFLNVRSLTEKRTAKKLGIKKVIVNFKLKKKININSIIDFSTDENFFSKIKNILGVNSEIILFGYKNSDLKINSNLLINNQISLRGSHGYSSTYYKNKIITDIERSHEIILKKKLKVKDLISKIYNFNNVKTILNKVVKKYKRKKNNNSNIIFREIFLKKNV